MRHSVLVSVAKNPRRRSTSDGSVCSWNSRAKRLSSEVNVWEWLFKEVNDKSSFCKEMAALKSCTNPWSYSNLEVPRTAQCILSDWIAENATFPFGMFISATRAKGPNDLGAGSKSRLLNLLSLFAIHAAAKSR